MSSCSSIVGDGVIRGVLGAVDCQTRDFAEAGYSALTSSSSGFQIALTALLTIYVALVGWRMLFAAGGARLSDAAGIALRIGVILALVSSWATFQTLVFDVAAKAPTEIAAVVTAPMAADRSSLAAHPIDGLQIAYDQLTASAVAFGKLAGPAAKAYSSAEAAAAETLSNASGVLFMTTAGVIAAATLAIGVLTAVGPVFIALFLMPSTRGLFAGWVRALIASALILMLGWLGITLLLSVLEPWLRLLSEQRVAGKLEAQTATSAAALVFVFGVGQAGLVLGACVTAFGFRIRPAAEGAGRRISAATATEPTLAPQDASRIQRLAFDLQRDHALSETRTRLQPVSLAAASSSTSRAAGASTPSDRPARLGETYRRPAVGRRPAGGLT